MLPSAAVVDPLPILEQVLRMMELIAEERGITLTYQAEEGCLSLTGTRKTKRWQTIKVQWQNEKFQPRIKTFSGWTAEIIQHELDHCDGIII